LDTCTFLWIITDDPNLSEKARLLFSEKNNDVFLSAASAWEITVKYNLGKLALPFEPKQYIPEQRKLHQIESLSLKEESTFFLTKLPDFHKDPFDRILICQAITLDLIILTPDQHITRYPVRTDW